MERLTGVLGTVLPVLTMLGIGMLMRRLKFFTREDISAFKRFVVNITLPAVLFSAFATAAYDARSVFIPIIMFLICCLAYLLGKILGKLLKLPSRFVPFLCAGYEVGMLGYALYALLYGSANVGTLAVLDIGHVLFVFTLYKAMLSRMENGRANPAALVKELFASPTVLAILLGVLFGATGLFKLLIPTGFDRVLSATLDFIAGPTGAVILLTIGYDLVFSEIRWRATLKTVGLRLAVSLVLMGLTLLIGKTFLGGGQALYGAIIMLFMLPPPYVLPVMADDPEERAYVSSTLSVTTLISILAFAAMACFV